MAYIDTSTAPAQRPARGRLRPTRSQVGLMQCLVLSASGSRRSLLRRAADVAGWRPMACGELNEARRLLAQEAFHLVVVDLADERGDGRQQGFDALCREAASRGGVLLVACGAEGDVRGEILARQAGVWMYLPGQLDEPGLVEVCEAARQVSDQQIAIA